MKRILALTILFLSATCIYAQSCPSGTVPIEGGGTCATTAAGALANLGGAALAGAAFTGPVSAPALNGIVNVGAGGYATIALAYAALPATGGTILLQQDLTISSPYVLTIDNTSSNAKGVTLDLGGHQINCTNTSGVCLTLTEALQGGTAERNQIRNGTINYTGSSTSVTGLEILGTATTFDIDALLIENFFTTSSICLKFNAAQSATVSGGTRLSNCYGGEYITGESTNIHHYGMQINNQVSIAGQCGGTGGTAGVPILIDNAIGITYEGGLIQKSCNANAIVINSTASTNGDMVGFDFNNFWIEDVGNTSSPDAAIRLYAGASHNIVGFSFTNSFLAEDTFGVGSALIDYTGDGSAQTENPLVLNPQNYYPSAAIGTQVTGLTAISGSNGSFAWAEAGLNINGISGLHLWPQTGGHHYNLWAGDTTYRSDAGNLSLSDLTSGATYPTPFHYTASTGLWVFPFVKANALSLATDSNVWKCTSSYTYTDSDLLCSYNGTNSFRFDNLGNMYFGAVAGHLTIPYTVAGYQGPAAGYVQLALAPSAITSATGGTNTGTVTCLTAACTNISGTYSVVGSTFTTGNLLVLVWPTTTTAYHCWTSQNGGIATYGIGHSVATATGMTITAGISVATATVTIDYGCSAN